MDLKLLIVRLMDPLLNLDRLYLFHLIKLQGYLFNIFLMLEE